MKKNYLKIWYRKVESAECITYKECWENRKLSFL